MRSPGSCCPTSRGAERLGLVVGTGGSAQRRPRMIMAKATIPRMMKMVQSMRPRYPRTATA